MIDSLALLLGHPTNLLGALALTGAGVVIWLLVAVYGLNFSTLRSLQQPRLLLNARVESSQRGVLVTGESAHLSVAVFSLRGQTYRAVGFGDTDLKPGQAVKAIVPESAPSQAWIQGLQRFPVRLSGLARISALLLAPGALLTFWGLAAGLRQLCLLRNGRSTVVQRTRSHKLPRPLADKRLDRYQVLDSSQAFWSLGSSGPERAPALLGTWEGAMLWERLLPRPGQGDTRHTSAARRACAGAVVLFWSLSLGMSLAFLGT